MLQGNLLLHLLELLLLLSGLHLLHGLCLGGRSWLHDCLDLLLLLQLVHLLHLLELLLLLSQLVLEDGLGDLLLLLHLLLLGRLLGLKLLRLEVGLLLGLLEVRLLLLLKLKVLKVIDALLGELASDKLRIGEHVLEQRLVIHLLKGHNLLHVLRLSMELLLGLSGGRDSSLLLTKLDLVEVSLRSCELPSDDLLGGLLLRVTVSRLGSLLLDLLLNVKSLCHLVGSETSLGLASEGLLGLLGELLHLLLRRNLHANRLRLAYHGFQLLVLNDGCRLLIRSHADHLRLRLGDTDALGVLLSLASSGVNSASLSNDLLGDLLLGCSNLVAGSHLLLSLGLGGLHGLRLLLPLLFTFLDTTLGILLLSLGLLLVLRDAVFNVLL